MLITCSEDKMIKVWNTTTGKPLVCYKGHKEIPTCCDVYENKVASADVSTVSKPKRGTFLTRIETPLSCLESR